MYPRLYICLTTTLPRELEVPLSKHSTNMLPRLLSRKATASCDPNVPVVPLDLVHLGQFKKYFLSMFVAPSELDSNGPDEFLFSHENIGGQPLTEASENLTHLIEGWSLIEVRLNADVPRIRQSPTPTL